MNRRDALQALTAILASSQLAGAAVNVLETSESFALVVRVPGLSCSTQTSVINAVKRVIPENIPVIFVSKGIEIADIRKDAIGQVLMEFCGYLSGQPGFTHATTPGLGAVAMEFMRRNGLT